MAVAWRVCVLAKSDLLNAHQNVPRRHTSLTLDDTRYRLEDSLENTVFHRVMYSVFAVDVFKNTDCKNTVQAFTSKFDAIYYDQVYLSYSKF